MAHNPTVPAKRKKISRAAKSAVQVDDLPCPEFSRSTRAECFADLIRSFAAAGTPPGPADLIYLEAMAQILYRVRRYGGSPSINAEGEATGEEQAFRAALRELRLYGDKAGLSRESRRKLEMTDRTDEQQDDLSRLRIA